jgi:hypothetical protein
MLHNLEFGTLENCVEDYVQEGSYSERDTIHVFYTSLQNA